MGIYKYLSDAWTSPREVFKKYLVQWRRDPVTLRLEHPTRVDKARALGYHAKQGIFVVRQRVSRGGHIRPDWSGGRHSHNMGITLNLRKNYQHIAEERANKVYPNCEVLNSYYVGEDGKFYWYEVIMADPANPSVLADKRTAWLGQPQHKNRVNRGLTSAGKRTRGLLHKGIGSEKARPSRRAHSRRL
ncbi:MAG TPA: 50S ribosomal protein L15e [Candidatus Nanoarchaeia archaeon]|nr:50S ribosomal protein L15e [Candidatus Nanoarchaeia archaeon]